MNHFRITYRFVSFLSGVVITFSLLFFRAVDLQLVKGSTYLHKAEDNRFFTHPLPARRGIILDRYGDPVVWNIQKYFQVADPKSLYESRQPIARDDALKVLTSSDSASIVTDTERLYRYPQALAHTIGYVGEVTAEDLQRDATLQVGQHIGKAGLEYTFEKELRGRDGTVTYEIDALAKKQREVSRVESHPGQDIATSLDPYLTEKAAQEIKNVRGTVIMTDVETGKILALTSQPGFDPNLLSQSFAEKDREAARKSLVQGLFNDPNKLFFNRAISGAYPPGSVFKVVTSFAGLENGKVTSETQVVDEGKIQVGEFEFGNWYYRQYGRVEGPLEITKAIGRSNDIFFYKVAEWTGPTKLAEMARLFGLGDKTGIELPAEAKGLVPDPEWKEKTRGEKWFLGNTYHFGIGQGDVLTSPVQISQMLQAVASDGKKCKVSLLANERPTCQELSLKEGDAELVLRGMIKACSSGGTAFPFFPFNTKRLQEGRTVQQDLESGAIACKTGTAEFGAQDAQGYRKTHGWFVGFLELPELKKVSGSEESQSGAASGSASVTPSSGENAGTPAVLALNDTQLQQKWKERVSTFGFPRKIAITVLVESDEHVPFREGSRDAAPIAKNIVEWMLRE